MKLKKYLTKMTDSLNVNKQKYSSRKACLKQVLKKLKKQKQELKSQLKNETSDKRCKSIKGELKVIQTQRKKGLKALKELQKESK